MKTIKNGRAIPIIKLTKSCPVCGFNLDIESHKEGGLYKSPRTYWVCSQDFCKHKERAETSIDKQIRMGGQDKASGILPVTDTEEI